MRRVWMWLTTLLGGLMISAALLARSIFGREQATESADSIKRDVEAHRELSEKILSDAVKTANTEAANAARDPVGTISRATR